MPTFDKLSICNTALLRTGNTLVAVEGEGTDEWISASDAYDTYLPVVLEGASWNFASEIVTLQRLGDSTHPDYEDMFAKPAGCLYVQMVWVREGRVDYQILGNRIHTTARGYDATCQFIAAPSESEWSQMFAETLRLFVMSALYRGLNEDTTEADKAYQAAYAMLRQASARVAQNAPPRARMNSVLVASRRARRIGSPYDPTLPRR